MIAMVPIPSLARRLVLLVFITISAYMNTSSSRFRGSSNPEKSGLENSKEPVITEPFHSNLRHQSKKSKYQFGLAVAHCQEDMSWIDGVDDITLVGEDGNPYTTTWDVSVYERCGKRVSEKYSEWQRNLGSEECTAYLKYIVDRYYELPEIVYFLQPDSLSFNPDKQHQHTNFNSLQDLASASAPIMMKSEFGKDKVGYLNLGNEAAELTKLVSPKGPNSNPSEILDMMKERAPHYEKYSYLRVAIGACHAVSRERIMANPVEFYKDLMLNIIGMEEERWTCWGLEATWHVIFGEPLEIPSSSTIRKYEI